MANKRRISEEEAKQVGTTLRLDLTKVDLEQFRRGLEVELEHGVRDPETNVTNDDLTLTGKIAWAHLKEFPRLLYAFGQAGSGSRCLLGLTPLSEPPNKRVKLSAHRSLCAIR